MKPTWGNGRTPKYTLRFMLGNNLHPCCGKSQLIGSRSNWPHMLLTVVDGP